jgi:hypothetical protein
MQMQQQQQPHFILPATSRKVSATNQQATSGHKPPWLQQPLSSIRVTTNLVETTYVTETS